MSDPIWYCCRQRAGPLVKECRALRPRFAPADTDEDRRAKADIKRMARCAVNRSTVDRLELRLALIGPNGMHYTLTFDDEHLPADFYGVRRQLTNFLKRAQRWLVSCGKPPPFDYVYAIEGLHGNHRYHVHFVCNADDLPPAAIVPSESGDWLGLWRCGIVDMEPVLLTRRYLHPDTGEPVVVSDGAYRRLAKYFNKEREDGFWIPLGRHPWSASRCLTARLPAPELWTSDSGVIEVPDNVIYARRGHHENDFGSYYYASYVISD
ncbi:MAG: hypothetical protein IJV43_01590 [Oscillospiraceae bacterium]|nr:hypothetical protein [Oscillospiraceae bacterium]